ncbi:MAG: acetylglutamate kinase [candidate division KSB1 bacterium]|nr:acetylglutamate kinase [candidate division KSB1 bacterium]
MRAVLKVSGKLIENPDLLAELGQALRDFRQEKVVIVHGGGPAITDLLQRLGIQARFHAGQRVTDEATLEVAEMVLSGKMNKTIVAALSRQGVQAIGLSGRDAELLAARPLSGENGKLGLVGEIERVRTDLLESLCRLGLIPVISPISAGPDGCALNVNADWAASRIATDWKADSLLYFGDTPGVLADGRTLPELNGEAIASLIREGEADRGMIPKLESAHFAARAGVRQVQILQWDGVDTLKRALREGGNLGTLVRS